MRCGVGQAIGLAEKPGGSRQLMLTASPESPGLRQ
jgi:hypothetical protein